MEIIRSWLIAPANRPDFLRKFPSLGADCSVIDLEDGTPEQHKVEARDVLAENVRKLRREGLTRGLYIRVNHPRSPHHVVDIQAAANTEADGIVIPKLSSVNELKAAVAVLKPFQDQQDREYKIIGGIESALGVVNVTDIALSGLQLVGLYFGAEDYATDLLGARRTPEGLEVLYARSRVALAAKAARITAIDQGVLEIRDAARFTQDSEMARNLGYDGKVCLNPSQVELANKLFSPTEEEVAFSARLVKASREAEQEGRGTIDFEGRMIDGPLLKRCEHILALAKQWGSA